MGIGVEIRNFFGKFVKIYITLGPALESWDYNE